MKIIKNINSVDKKDVSVAGGKGASLGELMRVKIPVPPGFIILTSVFERFLEETDINVEIEASWDKINIKDVKSIENNSEILIDLILKAKMPKDIEKEILKNFKKLKANYVAIRSSATVEDSKIYSWAGELESYLNITERNLIQSVKKCWASLYRPRAIFYRAERGLKRKKISVAVIVQEMIQSEVSGVCFTVHPITKNKNQMIIEGAKGLGGVVQGEVVPDSYVIGKDRLNILDINVSSKKQKLSNKQIKSLAELCVKIEKHYNKPQDIEWVLKKNKFYIVQSRPITTTEGVIIGDEKIGFDHRDMTEDF